MERNVEKEKRIELKQRVHSKTASILIVEAVSSKNIITNTEIYEKEIKSCLLLVIHRDSSL